MSKCKHDRRMTGQTSRETITVCGDCGVDLTIRTDPKLRAVIEEMCSHPPEVAAAAFIVGRIGAVLR